MYCAVCGCYVITNSDFAAEALSVYMVPALPGTNKQFRRQLHGSQVSQFLTLSPTSIVMSPPGAVLGSEPDREITADGIERMAPLRPETPRGTETKPDAGDTL